MYSTRKPKAGGSIDNLISLQGLLDQRLPKPRCKKEFTILESSEGGPHGSRCDSYCVLDSVDSAFRAFFFFFSLSLSLSLCLFVIRCR